MIDLGFEPEVQKILEFLPVSNMKPDTGFFLQEIHTTLNKSWQHGVGHLFSPSDTM